MQQCRYRETADIDGNTKGDSQLPKSVRIYADSLFLFKWNIQWHFFTTRNLVVFEPKASDSSLSRYPTTKCSHCVIYDNQAMVFMRSTIKLACGHLVLHILLELFWVPVVASHCRLDFINAVSMCWIRPKSPRQRYSRREFMVTATSAVVLQFFNFWMLIGAVSDNTSELSLLFFFVRWYPNRLVYLIKTGAILASAVPTAGMESIHPLGMVHVALRGKLRNRGSQRVSTTCLHNHYIIKRETWPLSCDL